MRESMKRPYRHTLRSMAALSLAMLSFLGLTIAMPAHTFAAVTSPQPAAKVSFTFDDGYLSALQKAAPVLAEYGMTGTEYIITGNIGKTGYLQWPQVTQLQQQYGWEIGSHTVSHPELSVVDAAKLERELLHSKTVLESKGFTPTSFASPYGDYTNITLAAIARHYAIHRPFWDTEGTNVWPYNDYLLQVKQVQAGIPIEQVQAYIDQAKKKNLWLVLVFHNITDLPSATPEDYEYSTTELRQIAAYVKARHIPVVKMSEGIVTSSVNALPNPTFNQGISDGWSTDNAAYVQKNSASKGSYPNPQQAIEFNVPEAGNGAHLFSPRVDVVAGVTYMIKSFLNVEKITSGEVTFYIDEYDQAGKWISGQYKMGERTAFVENINFAYRPSSLKVKQASLQIGVSGGSGVKAYVDNVQWFSLNK